MILEIRKNSFSINKTELKFPFSLDKIVLVLGEPTQKICPSGDKCWGAIWDDLGIECGFGYRGFDNCFSMSFYCNEWNPKEISTHFNIAPKSKFIGTLIINKKVTAYNDFNYLNFGSIDITNLQYGLYVTPNIDYKEKVPLKKYLLRQIDDNDILFNDFNFKLLIIQELMYNQKLIKPQFDLDEFVRWFKKREIDLEEEEGLLIPEVVEYFTNLPIPKKLAKKIVNIRQDGGNEIYANIINCWDGENGLFDVLNFEDIVHFPHLKELKILETAYWNEARAKNQLNSIQELRKKGIEVNYV